MNLSFLLPKFSVVSSIIATLCLFSSSAHAEFFKYKDSSGAVVITNKLSAVPKKYRKNVTVIWDDELTAKDPLARRTAAAEAQRKQQQSQQARQQEKQEAVRKVQPSDGKKLVITFDEETGQVVRTME